MSAQRTLIGNLFELLLDAMHRWSGELLGKSPSRLTAPPLAPMAPVTLPVASIPKQPLVAITALLEPVMAEELVLLAQAMQTSESDVLVRMVKIARMIREYGLYGVPTPDGNQLGIYVRRTQEVHKINLECPAQQNHRPPATPVDGGKPPAHLN